jgi:arabinose-5-phosphate isomerase
VRRGFQPEDFAELHPGGKLGKKLRRVRDLMHPADRVPAVPPDAPIRDLIVEMSKGRLGMATIQQEGRLVGVVSDGDLRRLLERDADPLARMAGEIATKQPVTISPDRLASEGLRIMEERKITFLVVAEGAEVAGVLHLHDLWGLDLF